jgi:hypothetical protein
MCHGRENLLSLSPDAPFRDNRVVPSDGSFEKAISVDPQYFVMQSEHRSGPYSASELKQLAATGRLQAQHLVLNPKTNQWVKASAFKNLIPAAAETAVTQRSESLASSPPALNAIVEPTSPTTRGEEAS